MCSKNSVNAIDDKQFDLLIIIIYLIKNMNEKKVKKSISGKQITLGSWIQIPNVFTTEIIARSGFDWLAIDLEHGLIDLETAFRLIQVIDCSGVIPLVRLHTNDDTTIRRVMDAGAGGVIVPMINTAEEAQRVVNAVKYPPLGKRSFGLGRAHNFGITFEEYIREVNDTSIVVVQIEHIDALKNLDKILKVPGIDAMIIGPYDLSGSIGTPGQFNHPKFREILGNIIDHVKKSPVALGIHIVHPSEHELKERLGDGFTFIGFGMDTIFLQEGSHNAVKYMSGKR
jgi:2-dehydro-3-deoxyglucarate aldolase